MVNDVPVLVSVLLYISAPVPFPVPVPIPVPILNSGFLLFLTSHQKTKANQKWFPKHQRNPETYVKTYLPSRITTPNRDQVTLYFF